jgi:hypothetical protein
MQDKKVEDHLNRTCCFNGRWVRSAVGILSLWADGI